MRFFVFHQPGTVGYYIAMTAMVISCITLLALLLKKANVKAGNNGGEKVASFILGIPVFLGLTVLAAIQIGLIMTVMVSIITFPASLYRDYVILPNMKPAVTTNHVMEAKTAYVVNQAMQDAEKRFTRATASDFK